MKKGISFLLAVCLLLSVSPIAFGAVAGQYYYTDIVTYLNGVEIDAINIGGETLISAEDMQYYSFRVQWLPIERELHVNSIPHAENGKPPVVKRTSGVVGTVRGNYYETDIVTYLDGTPIIAYNIGGRTYMHAEEMRHYGYIVDWSPEKWTLSITSPDRNGYVYDIPLSFGKEKQAQGVGNAEVTYQNNERIGKGDADYFDLTMEATTKGYTFHMVFYQNQALFYSEKLQACLRPLISFGPGVEEPRDPLAQSALVNETVMISINGQVAKDVVVESGAGNGHRDYYFTVSDLPRYKESEIESISFSVGEPTGEIYAITQPVTDSFLVEKAVEKLKKYPLDFVKTWYITEDYFVIYMCESKSLGEITDRLYLFHCQTGDVSADVLEQVRTQTGFNDAILHPFAFSHDETSRRFFFSVKTEKKTGDFYIDLNEKTVHVRL